MGDLQKFPDNGPDASPFVETRHSLDALCEALDASAHVTLVGHRRESGALSPGRFARIGREAIVKPGTWSNSITAYGARLTSSDAPGLYMQVDPGRMPPEHHACSRQWPARIPVSVRGLHDIQKDSPHAVGQAVLRNPPEE